MTARLLPLLLCGIGSLRASYSHRTWRTEDGLPHNRVQAMAQTSEGYLWLGTSEGLARFDGSRFVTFDRSNTPALKDNSILSLEVVPDGTLWIGTEGGGLVHYAQGGFQTFGTQQGLTNGFVRATHFDRQGTLWVGTDRGLFRYSAGRFVRADGTLQVPLASVISIAEDAAGTLWVATAAGLLEFSERKLRRASCTDPPSIDAALAVALVAEKLAHDGCSPGELRLPHVPVTSLHKDTAGNLWIGTANDGLLCLNLSSGATQAYTAPSALPDNTIVRVFEDRQHNIWAAAQGGLVRFSRAAVGTVDLAKGLEDEHVSITYEDRQQDLWIITFSGQIYRWKAGIADRYFLPEPARGARIRTVFQDDKNGYWFGSSGNGAFYLVDGKMRQFTKSGGLRSDSIRQIFEDSSGTIWFATGSGISAWNGSKFTSYYLEEGLSYPSVRCIAETADGDILAGTDAGLNIIHKGKIIADSVLASLKQEKIWSLYVDAGGYWLGTRGGGLVLVRNGKITRFTTREGLVSNSIYQIIDDHAGRLWMSSPVGLFSVLKTELDDVANHAAFAIHAVSYGTSDGMSTSQMSSGIQPAGCRRSSGELWFPTLRGAVRLDPAHLPSRQSEPAFIESISAGDSLLPLAYEVTIPPGRGRVQIDFTSCDLTAPQQVSFRYKLEGVDDVWTIATHQRSATYSNLPSGHFRFRVAAESSGTSNPGVEASLLIYRKPEFHQTGWFYSMLAVLLGCSLWGGIWIYTRQTKARFALLLNERTRLAREMHDTVIQGCVGVSTLLEATARLQRTDPDEANYLLAHARTEIKATLEEARQAVWDLRNSTAEQFSIVTLLDLARKLGNEHNVEVSTQIRGEQKALDSATARTLLLVGREALRNSVAHGSPGQISLCITFEAKQVRMEVKDNGTGFNPNPIAREQTEHFGIIGMRERVEQLAGTFTIQSKPGEGTTVTVSLPVLTQN